MVRPSVQPGAVVAILGAGNMGSGIAQACAQAGYRVRVRDVGAPMLARGRSLVEQMLEGGIRRKKLTIAKREEILGRIEWTLDAAGSVRDAALVIEAVFEEESVKRSLFAEVAPAIPASAIVATNTSSLSVSRLSEGFPEPGRFAGLHFFYPAAINKLVEVIGGDRTDPGTVEELERFCYALRKIPIRVQDAAGFAVNRYFVPFLNEAARMAGEGLASLATIEEVGRATFGTTLGPFELMNVTGIPIAFQAESSLAAAFGPAYAPCSHLEAQFKAGVPWAWKGSDAEPSKKPEVRDRFLGLTFGIAARLVDEGVATAEAVDRGAVVGLRWATGPFALLNSVGLPEGLAMVRQYAARWPGEFPVSQGLGERVARGEARWPLSPVRVERRGAVAWVLIDRPEVLNSLNSEVLRALDDTFGALEGDASLRCVVLAGSGPVFAAGADIREMESKGQEEGRAFGFAGQAVCRRIEEFRTPVVALVEGYALGGGLELALACDFIVAAEGARLGLPESSVGIHPAWGGASRLVRNIGAPRTKLLIYSAQPVSSAEAERLGIVARVVGAASAREEVQSLAETIASRAPLALAMVKSVLREGSEASLEGSLRLEGESAGRTFGTKDRAEGMRAFRERRPPKFEGR
jgi:enoyl-CoA hydratase/3-hydroxyacyl-CoA dehydrogenase